MLDTFVGFGKRLAREIANNSPAILTGLAATGVISTTVLAVKATPKAIRILEHEVQEKYEKDFENVWPSELLTKREIVRLTWKCYVPTAVVGGMTIACIIGANSIHTRRNAALASLYSLTESAFKEYQEKVVETIGKNKELKVRDDVAADKIARNPVGNAEVFFTGKGETLCYDSMSGRYFKTDIEKVRRARDVLNRQLRSEMFITLNEFYDELGLSPIKLGEEMGWSIDKDIIEISFSAQLTETDEPCLVLNYDVIPRNTYG